MMRTKPSSTAITLLLLVLVSGPMLWGLAGCSRPPDAPPAAQTPAPSPPPERSRPTLNAAATALDERNAEAFAATLTAPLRVLADSGGLDLSGPGVPLLAQAIREAKVVAQDGLVHIYETVVEGEKHYFYAYEEEDGQWRLGGL